MSLDPRFVTAVSLEPYFVDKDTGAPLAGGTVEFWQDDQRTTPKLVYQLTGSPPNYEYSPLPNPITLSSVGTIEDNFGNNVALYYFPYDSFEPDANVQLYYVVVKNSLGVPQFVREGWPNTSSSSNANLVENNVANELSNPQFVDVLFNNDIPLEIDFFGANTTTITIAPDWVLRIVHTDDGTVTVTRTSVVGSSAYPGNPPYVLSIVAGNNIGSLKLIQKLENNPDIWSRAVGGVNGYLSGTILLAPLSSVTMNYVPSVGTIQQIFTANNTTGAYAEFGGTIQLDPCNNTDNSNDGFVNIELDLPTLGTTTLSNVQVVGLSSNISLVPFDQTTANRQKDFLFHYYNSLLQFKPINSYLVGWDFPFNPTQFLGPTLAASAAGANTSRYVWDQTIVFQSENSGPAISRAPTGALRITATNDTQACLIQYSPQEEARKILNQRVSVNVSAVTSINAGLPTTVSLFYTNDALLPDLNVNNSLVATIDAVGRPLTFNGNWTEIQRNIHQNVIFDIQTSDSNNFNNYGFSGWESVGGVDVENVTYFAIVVGTSTIPAGATVDFNSISLVPGDIPTIPAPLSFDETLRKCEYYYEKSFPIATVPATNLGQNGTVSVTQVATVAQGGQLVRFQCKTRKYASAPLLTIYNPQANANGFRCGGSNYATAVNFAWDSGWGCNVQITDDGNIGVGMIASWVMDSRLGIV